MKRRTLLVVAILLVVAVGSFAQAQQGGRGGRGGFNFGGFGGGGGDLLGLVRVEAVQKEIEALEDQVATTLLAAKALLHRARVTLRGNLQTYVNV